jgi:hypothetical protein
MTCGDSVGVFRHGGGSMEAAVVQALLIVDRGAVITVGTACIPVRVKISTPRAGRAAKVSQAAAGRQTRIRRCRAVLIFGD